MLSLSRRPGRAPSGAPAGAGSAADPVWWQRLLWLLVACALINWSIQILGAATSFTWVGVLVVLGGAWGLGTAVVATLPAPRLARLGALGGVAGWLTAGVLIVLFVAWTYVQVRNGPGYGTDELAFDQYAAQLAEHGLNPYVHSMAPAFALFQVSPDGYSYNLAGQAVTQLSYPALAFLVYLPFLALHITGQLAVAVNVGAWALTVVLLFALLPRPLRPVALIVASVAVYGSYAVGGVTDVLYLPFLVIAAYRWDRFGETRLSLLGPVALGLAMAVKQTPWPLLAFLVCGLAADTYARAGARAALRRAGAYLLISLGAFLLPNLPYLLSTPGAWLRGIVVPITSQLVPAGQGAVGLTLFAGVGGGSLSAFTIATGLLGVVLLLVFLGTRPLLWPATFVLPSIILFFASRSYGSYLVSLLPVLVISAATVRHAPASRVASESPGEPADGGGVQPHSNVDGAPEVSTPSRRPRGRRIWAAALLAATLAFAAALTDALAAGAPLGLRITSIRTTGQLATIQQLTLAVSNHTGRPLRPDFTLDEGGQVTTFWLRSAGPAVIAPHHTASVSIIAPNFPAQPPITGGFSVMAFTQGPNTVSVTGPYIPASLHLALLPAAVNAEIPVGREITVRAQLFNHLDAPVARANEPVYLGQIIYDQGGLILSEAQINNANPGQTPVRAYTNAHGVATFHIRDSQPDLEPVYFEANLVNATNFYPYGYSNILPIRFIGR